MFSAFTVHHHYSSWKQIKESECDHLLYEELKILRKAKQTENHAMIIKFYVSKSCKHDWIKKKDLLLQISDHWQADHGDKAKFPETEEKLPSHLSERRQFGYMVSSETHR